MRGSCIWYVQALIFAGTVNNRSEALPRTLRHLEVINLGITTIRVVVVRLCLGKQSCSTAASAAAGADDHK